MGKVYMGLGLAAISLYLIAGCAALDSFLEVSDSADSSSVPDPAATIIDSVGSVVDVVAPGAGWLIAGLLTFGAVGYRRHRKKSK